MKKTKKDAEISRQRLLDAAEAVFCDSGYSVARINDIAARTGMTKGAVFWHFQSKAGLFKAVLVRSIARLKSIIEETLSTKEPVLERFRRALLRIRRDRAFEVLLSLGLRDDVKANKALLSDLRTAISGIFAYAAQQIENARQNGELRPDVTAGDILGPFVVMLSGCGRIGDLRMILEDMAGPIDGDAAIEALFDGIGVLAR